MIRGRDFDGGKYTIVFIDVPGFSVFEEDYQLAARRAMYSMVSRALGDAGAHWGRCYREDRGDGLLLLVPPKVPTNAIIGRFLPALNDALSSYNRQCLSELRIHLRAAIHVHDVHIDEYGAAGPGIVLCARLLEAPPLRAAMVHTTAHLGVCVSSVVYENALNHADRAGWRSVHFSVEEVESTAWMRLYGLMPKRSEVSGGVRATVAPRPLGRLPRRLVAVAALVLPSVERERYREEWVSLLTEVASRRERARQLCSLLAGAPRQSWVLRRPLSRRQQA